MGRADRLDGSDLISWMTSSVSGPTTSGAAPRDASAPGSTRSASRPPSVLFISNGHGEDHETSHVIRALWQEAPDIQCAALPIVGEGHAYRAFGMPILGPAETLPSGGFTYVNRWRLLDDLRAGLVGQTLRQIGALRARAKEFDVVVGTGDWVTQSFARASGRPYLCYIASLSAMYEGTLKVGPILGGAFRSDRRLDILTRDKPTADDLARQGFARVHFGGLPSLDWIRPTGLDLALDPGHKVVALLPGSRLPEAERNLAVMLRFAAIATAAGGHPLAFRAALVPALAARLPQVAADAGWTLGETVLTGPEGRNGRPRIHCPPDAYNDILLACDIVIGMAGLAVDQAVAIGKPVLQIAGEGPQFNARFAEAQERLLGLSLRTIGPPPVTDDALAGGAALMQATFDDTAYLKACARNGRERLGTPGGAHRIAARILAALGRSKDHGSDAAQ